jgi:PDZ domain
MRPRLIVIVLAAAAALGVMIVAFQPRHRPVALDPTQTISETLSNPPNSAAQASVAEQPFPPSVARQLSKPATLVVPEMPAISTTNKLERLALIRERFRTLAGGEAGVALRAAKQVIDETERETALMTLATEWTNGELRRPRERAWNIERYGIEAGLGLELIGNPELAQAWADELTAGPGRQALLTEIAISLTGSDPAAAFALTDQMPAEQRTNFVNSVFAGWGWKDTEAALQWANQLPEQADRDAAVGAIRTSAPVGIGTVVRMQDGYPVINNVLPGTPAELSGQFRQGDRILALAQGDSAFVNAQGIPLSDVVQMIRGAPGTTLQLQILPADAPPGSSPQTISLIRDQIKFKR